MTCIVFSFPASTSPMDNIKLPKNFILSRECMKATIEAMKATLEAFKADKSMADVTREVFQVFALASAS